MDIINFITERIKSFLSPENPARAEDADQDEFFRKEKLIAFGISFFFALCLWFVVNMNRDFNVTIDVPIQLTNLPDDVAVSSDIPENASVNLTGEGWNLIKIYRNPPPVNLSADSRQINLFDQLRNQSNAYSDMSIMQVEPILLTIETETKATKMVPLQSRVEFQLEDQFGPVSSPELEPDSVRLTGPQSVLEELNEWETDTLILTNIRENVEIPVDVRSPSSGVSIEPQTTVFRLEIAEFTESEIRVPVRTRNLPSGKAVTYNPSSIVVRFDVPLDQYSQVQGTRPFAAYVDYSTIEQDSTGLVTPEIERVDSENSDLTVRLRSFQPARVSYYNIIPD